MASTERCNDKIARSQTMHCPNLSFPSLSRPDLQKFSLAACQGFKQRASDVEPEPVLVFPCPQYYLGALVITAPRASWLIRDGPQLSQMHIHLGTVAFLCCIVGGHVLTRILEIRTVRFAKPKALIPQPPRLLRGETLSSKNYTGSGCTSIENRNAKIHKTSAASVIHLAGLKHCTVLLAQARMSKSPITSKPRKAKTNYEELFSRCQVKHETSSRMFAKVRLVSMFVIVKLH